MLVTCLSNWFLKIYPVSPVFLNIFILYLFLANGPQALYVNPALPSATGCLKYISGINLSLANINLLIMSFILHSCTQRNYT